MKQKQKHYDNQGSIRRINFGFFLRNSNLREYGGVSIGHLPGTPHKGQEVLLALVEEFILPLISKESVVLDLGCRNLDLAVFLGEHVDKIVNVDISPSTVAWAQHHGFYAICASADDLNIASNSIDIFHASHVFEHVPNLAKSLFEAMRVLRHEGVLFVRVPISSYYRYHRYCIESVEALVSEIQKQCPCEILYAGERTELGNPEVIVLAQKVGDPISFHQRYKYDLMGTIRGMIWRFRQKFSSSNGFWGLSF